MRETVENMRNVVRRMMRGHLTIGECELELNRLIAEATMEVPDIDIRLYRIRILKRKAWRMLLDATK